MAEILLPDRYRGGTRNATGSKGPRLRLGQVRKTFGYLPVWRCEIPETGVTFYVCGKCFAKKGDGPFSSRSELWFGCAHGSKMVPPLARCEDCGGPLWPKD